MDHDSLLGSLDMKKMALRLGLRFLQRFLEQKLNVPINIEIKKYACGLSLKGPTALRLSQGRWQNQIICLVPTSENGLTK